MDTTVESGRCSLRKCIQGDLELGMARVEVNSIVVKADERQHMEVCIKLKFIFLHRSEMQIRIDVI